MTFVKLKITTLLFALLIPQILSAVISGIGYGATKYEAQKEALADLSLSIKSEVRTYYESYMSTKGIKSENNAFSNIKISSNLPIMGAQVSYKVEKLKIVAEMKLMAYYSKESYITKLKNLKIEIESILKTLNKAKKSSLKLELYLGIYSLLKEYDRYESVAAVLKLKLPSRPDITKQNTKSEIAKISSNIDSLSLASKVLASEFLVSRIYTYPVLLQHNTTVTEFASILQKKLNSKIDSVKTLKEADYFLVGEYIVTKKGIVLNYELLSIEMNRVVQSKTININPKAYKSLEVKPKNIDFDQLLNSGIISSSDLKVSLSSSRGSENLLFRKAEEIELFVKLNKMGYYYIVGYTQTKEGKMSYLLELSEGMGDSKFIKFVNADDASKWQSLGAFEVDAPYGIESLQVIASNKKITNLPSYKYDKLSEYYVISRNLKKALAKTRGLKHKKSTKIEMSEDVMSFTTMKQ